jgi:hypothetical protein
LLLSFRLQQPLLLLPAFLLLQPVLTCLLKLLPPLDVPGFGFCSRISRATPAAAVVAADVATDSEGLLAAAPVHCCCVEGHACWQVALALVLQLLAIQP